MPGPTHGGGRLCFIRVKPEKEFTAWISLPRVSAKREPAFRGSRAFHKKPTHRTGRLVWVGRKV